VLVRGASILSAELGERHVAYVTAGSGGMRGESQMHIHNLATGSDKMVYRARSGDSNHASIFRASYIAGPKGFCGREQTSAREAATGSCATR